MTFADVVRNDLAGAFPTIHPDRHYVPGSVAIPHSSERFLLITKSSCSGRELGLAPLVFRRQHSD